METSITGWVSLSFDSGSFPNTLQARFSTLVSWWASIRQTFSSRNFLLQSIWLQSK